MKFTLAAILGAAALVSANNTTVPLTTSVVYATQIHTISECAVTVTDCPYRTAPVIVTSTIALYTTICPVTATQPSVKPTPIIPVPVSSSAPVVPIGTGPASVPVGPPATTIYSSAGMVPPTKTATSSMVKYTAAGNANAAGGLLMAAGFLAALL